MMPEPTATITVRVYPIGEPGKVGITVDTEGSAKKTYLPHEAARMLRQAASWVERQDDVIN